MIKWLPKISAKEGMCIVIELRITSKEANQKWNYLMFAQMGRKRKTRINMSLIECYEDTDDMKQSATHLWCGGIDWKEDIRSDYYRRAGLAWSPIPKLKNYVGLELEIKNSESNSLSIEGDTRRNDYPTIQTESSRSTTQTRGGKLSKTIPRLIFAVKSGWNSTMQ